MTKRRFGVSSIEELNDVEIVSPVEGQVMARVAGKWKNTTISAESTVTPLIVPILTVKGLGSSSEITPLFGSLNGTSGFGFENPDGAAQGDQFGYCIGADDTYLLSADINYNSTQGRIVVLKKNNSGTYDYETSIVRSSPETNAKFGYEFAYSDGWLAAYSLKDTTSPLGALNPGVVRIFKRDSNWAEVQVLTSPNAESGGAFGGSISIYEDTMVIGAQNETISGHVRAGHAYIYKLINGTWTYSATLARTTPQDTSDFGHKVCVYKSTLVVVDGYSASGQFTIFETTDGTTWTRSTTISRPDYTGSGNDALSIGDNLIAISTGTYPSTIALYKKGESGWVSDGTLADLSSGGSWTISRRSLLIVGDMIVAGDIMRDGQAGVVYIYWKDNGSWSSTIINGFGYAANVATRFGHAICAYKDRLFVSAIGGTGSIIGKISVFDQLIRTYYLLPTSSDTLRTIIFAPKDSVPLVLSQDDLNTKVEILKSTSAEAVVYANECRIGSSTIGGVVKNTTTEDYASLVLESCGPLWAVTGGFGSWTFS